MSRRTHKKYSSELRLKAVEDYLSDKGAMKQIREKYRILANKQLININWIKWYNGHRDF